MKKIFVALGSLLFSYSAIASSTLVDCRAHTIYGSPREFSIQVIQEQQDKINGVFDGKHFENIVAVPDNDVDDLDFGPVNEIVKAFGHTREEITSFDEYNWDLAPHAVGPASFVFVHVLRDKNHQILGTGGNFIFGTAEHLETSNWICNPAQ